MTSPDEYVWYREPGKAAHARTVRQDRYYGVCGRRIDELRATVTTSGERRCRTCVTFIDAGEVTR